MVAKIKTIKGVGVVERWEVPGSTNEFDAPLVVEPVPPTWRDFWRILRGKYVARIRVFRPMTVKAVDRIFKEEYTGPIAEKLHESQPLFEGLDGKE